MKILITFITVVLPFAAMCQGNLDTIRVRNLTLQAQDWAWFAGGVSGNDSLSVISLNIIRRKVQAAIPPNWTTNITIDSLPGRTVIALYQMTLTAPAAEIESRYSAIKSAIAAKTQVSYWVGLLDGATGGDFTRRRTLGKNKLID